MDYSSAMEEEVHLHMHHHGVGSEEEDSDRTQDKHDLNLNLNKTHPPTSPLLGRLDRLDIVIGYLEEKANSGKEEDEKEEEEEILKEVVEMEMEKSKCKPISWVLHDTETKGTIVERLSSLESRVTKLSKEVERVRSTDKVKEEEKGVGEAHFLKGMHDMPPSHCKPNLTVQIPNSNSLSDVDTSSSNGIFKDQLQHQEPRLDVTAHSTMNNNNSNNKSKGKRGKHRKLKKLMCMLPLSVH